MFSSAADVSLELGGGRKRGVSTGTFRGLGRTERVVLTEETLRAGVATVDAVGRSRWVRGGVIASRKGGRGAPPVSKVQSNMGGSLPVVVAVRRRVRVHIRSEGGLADRSAGVPSKVYPNTVGPEVARESMSCTELIDRGVDWMTVVAAARASGGGVMPSVGTKKTEWKAELAEG